MHKEFRNRVVKLGEKYLEWLEEYAEGQDLPNDKIEKAMKILQLSVKTSHIMQINENSRRSQSIRLIPYIPVENRDKYIALTNPEAKPFLLSKPENK